jgi:hypothetical protein
VAGGPDQTFDATPQQAERGAARLARGCAAAGVVRPYPGIRWGARHATLATAGRAVKPVNGGHGPDDESTGLFVAMITQAVRSVREALSSRWDPHSQSGETMEAHTLSPGVAGSASPESAQAARPREKDGGVAAGVVAVIRELGELLHGSGGLVVVTLGLLALMTITTASIGEVPDAERATVATAAFTVLGTIVGAYFGVRVGARGKDDAEAAHEVSAAKVERLAAHLPVQEAERVLDDVDSAVRSRVGRS